MCVIKAGFKLSWLPTVDDRQSQDATGAGSSHPVKELSNGPTRFLLQRNQHLDQHQALDTSSIQTQQSVHPIQHRQKTHNGCRCKGV